MKSQGHTRDDIQPQSLEPGKYLPERLWCVCHWWCL